MSTPPIPYNRQANFTTFSTEQFPTVGQDLEAEFNRVDESMDQTQDRLAEIQRDDGLLKNLAVHPDSLGEAVRALLAITAGGPLTLPPPAPPPASAEDIQDVFDAPGAVVRTQREINSEVVSLKRFGVVGDGVADDGPALQDALDYVRTRASAVGGWTTGITLHIPPGVYLTNQSLDFTGVRNLGVSIEAYGATIHGKCAGKRVLDLLFSRYITINGLTIIGDAVSTPDIGLQIGRKDSQVADLICLRDVTVAGAFSKASFYNHGSETSQRYNCKFYNNSAVATAYCVIMDGSNSWSAASDFVTVTATPDVPVSFNENTIIGEDIRRQTGGRAVAYSGMPSRHQWKGCYAVSVNDWAFYFYKVPSINQIDLDVHIETTGALGFVLIDNNNPASALQWRGFRLRDHNMQGSVAVIQCEGTTRQVILDGADIEVANIGTGVPLVGAGSGASSNFLITGDIRWEDADTFDMTNFRFRGRVFLETSTTVTHTLGSYELVRRPNSTDARAVTFKGELRVAGVRDTATEANYVSITGAAAGGVPEIAAGGTDTNLDLRLTPKGTGRVRFGTLTANADAPITGYIEVKDSAGTVRKLAVIA